MPLDNIVSALEHLGHPTRSPNADDEIRRLFCWEDTMLSKDVSLEVEGIDGKIPFPIDDNSIKKLIEISSKAKFGSGERTLLDTTVRDTQMIPANKLKVAINPETLSNILERINSGLNVDSNNTFELHLHNLLIYGPGQFFNKHRDSIKLPNMLATLVIVLPCSHKGGDLVIEHGNSQHIFFGSKIPEIIKCVAFYADCQHEIRPVTEGYRVAVTYNLVLNPHQIGNLADVDSDLDEAVADYFDGENEPVKFAFGLNHSYSERNLSWELLKGQDREYGHALLKVARKQGRIPFLVLMKYHEERDGDQRYGGDVLDSSTEFYHWINARSLPIDTNGYQEFLICDEEICCSTETTDLEPYQTEEHSPTGNAGATCDYWYRRACVVLFRNKWTVTDGFNSCVTELHDLTKQQGLQEQLLEKISDAGQTFLKKYDRDLGTADMLIDIVIYLNDSKVAERFLSIMANELLVEEKLEKLLKLQQQFDDAVWNKIIQNWQSKPWQVTVESVALLEKYKTLKEANQNIVDFLMWHDLKSKTGFELALTELHKFTINKIEVPVLLNKIDMLGHKFNNVDLWRTPDNSKMLFELILYLNNPQKAILILSKLRMQLLQMKHADLLISLEKQYSDDTWNVIKNNWRTSQKETLNNITPFIIAYKTLAPDSTLPSYLLSEFMQVFRYKQYSLKNMTFYTKIDDKHIAYFCQLLKICEDVGFSSEEQQLLEWASSQFPLVSKAEILIEIPKHIPADKITRYNTFVQLVLTSIYQNLSELETPNWSTTLSVTCSCHNCQIINNFLKSPTETKIQIPAIKSQRYHIWQQFDAIRGNGIKAETIRGNRPKLVMEKEPTVHTTRKNFAAVLKEIKTKIINIYRANDGQENVNSSVDVTTSDPACKRAKLF